jgi:hypothetical protein
MPHRRAKKGAVGGFSALLPVSRCYRSHMGSSRAGRHSAGTCRPQRGTIGAATRATDRSMGATRRTNLLTARRARRLKRPKNNIFALLILCGRLPAQANLGCLSPWLRFGSVSEVTPRAARGSMRRPSVLGPVFLSLWPDGNRPAELKSPSQCWLDPVGRLALERGNKVRLPRSIQIIRQFNWWVRSRRHNATSSR